MDFSSENHCFLLFVSNCAGFYASKVTNSVEEVAAAVGVATLSDFMQVDLFLRTVLFAVASLQ